MFQIGTEVNPTTLDSGDARALLDQFAPECLEHIDEFTGQFDLHNCGLDNDGFTVYRYIDQDRQEIQIGVKGVVNDKTVEAYSVYSQYVAFVGSYPGVHPDDMED